MSGYPMSTAGTQTYLSKSVNQNNFLKEQENKLEILKRKMATDYYEVKNFSFVSPGDYLYIIENDRPQKIKCIYVDKYTEDSGSNRSPPGTGPKMKKIYFVRVSNTNNSIIINYDKGEKIAYFDKKNEIITPNESYIDDGKIITGKDLFLYWNSTPKIKEKYQTQMIILTISDRILSDGIIKSCTPKNDELFNCFYFWKKKIIPTITRAKSASTFGGKRKKTKRRRQTRRKTKRQRKHK